MAKLAVVPIAPRSIEPLAELFGPHELSRAQEAVGQLSASLAGATIWNVSSTARGGGVAELLQSLVAYACGAGIDCRWVVIEGEPAFFQLTKHIHNALHGVGGNASFSSADRQLYEHALSANERQFLPLVKPQDVVILHDPQPAGLAPALARRGVRVIWRCHVGSDEVNDSSRAAMSFLAPYLTFAERHVFTMRSYVPDGLDMQNVRLIVPTIDPLTAKNQALSAEAVNAILAQAGLIDVPASSRGAAVFERQDGSSARVEHAAEVVRREGSASDGPLVVQISRWDHLKDHLGVLRGFVRFLSQGGKGRLILAGPNVQAVADDPEGLEVYREVLAAYRALPDDHARAIELASLPMSDADENAAIVNALQRAAAVVVQKSLQEGFGLTVAEAMWKGKPVIASRVGGICEQIEHGVSGLLLDDAKDEQGFAELLARLISEPELQRSLGRAARERVRERFLSLRSLYAYADLIGELLRSPKESAASGPGS